MCFTPQLGANPRRASSAPVGRHSGLHTVVRVVSHIQQAVTYFLSLASLALLTSERRKSSRGATARPDAAQSAYNRRFGPKGVWNVQSPPTMDAWIAVSLFLPPTAPPRDTLNPTTAFSST